MDLNDGALKEQYEAYRRRLDLAESLGLNVDHSNVPSKLTTIESEISDDLDFIHTVK